MNKRLYEYMDNYIQKEKKNKRNKQFHRDLDGDLVYGYLKKFKNLIYSILSIRNGYKSKDNLTRSKVRMSNIDNIYGLDKGESFKDLIQDGHLFILEALRKYGRPENQCSESTFVFMDLKRKFINLSKKASSGKYRRVDIEYSPEIMGE
jgi:hypothetical protein